MHLKLLRFGLASVAKNRNDDFNDSPPLFAGSYASAGAHCLGARRQSPGDECRRREGDAHRICCMLINILTGKKPNKWMVTLMSLYLSGWASDADVLREFNKPDNTGIKLRAKEALGKN